MSDLEGYAIRYDTVMPNGWVIAKGAFANQDGYTVPLTLATNELRVFDCIGNAVLSDREDGVYATCYFNDAPLSRAIKGLIEKNSKYVEMFITAAGCERDGDFVRSGRITRVYLKGNGK